jgi:hypothetical protein
METDSKVALIHTLRHKQDLVEKARHYTLSGTASTNSVLNRSKRWRKHYMHCFLAAYRRVGRASRHPSQNSFIWRASNVRACRASVRPSFACEVAKRRICVTSYTTSIHPSAYVNKPRNYRKWANRNYEHSFRLKKESHPKTYRSRLQINYEHSLFVHN